MLTRVKEVCSEVFGNANGRTCAGVSLSFLLSLSNVVLGRMLEWPKLYSGSAYRIGTDSAPKIVAACEAVERERETADGSV